MRVVILGCGPAGLAAAKAATDLGRETVIVSQSDLPSMLYGCQYLHAPVPGYENVPPRPSPRHLSGLRSSTVIRSMAIGGRGKSRRRTL